VLNKKKEERSLTSTKRSLLALGSQGPSFSDVQSPNTTDGLCVGGRGGCGESPLPGESVQVKQAVPRGDELMSRLKEVSRKIGPRQKC